MKKDTTKDITKTLAYKEWLSRQNLSPIDNADIKKRVIRDLKFAGSMNLFDSRPTSIAVHAFQSSSVNLY